MRFAATLFVCLGILAGAPKTAAADRSPSIDRAERQIILAYYQQIADHLYGDHSHRAGHGHNHGHARHGHGNGHADLPPGIARNLQRGKPLPPGIAAQKLPVSLREKLPPPPTGCERIVLDGRVLLIDIATRVIRDKLEDALIRD